jgi:periplasmic divalent cation tolerance protein
MCPGGDEMSTGRLVVLITVGGPEEGRKIADALVGQRNAACVSIVPQVRSVFRWEGKIEDEAESLLVVKTSSELFPELVSLVRGIHSSEVPEIIALPIVEGNEDYLEWIGEETRAE